MSETSNENLPVDGTEASDSAPAPVDQQSAEPPTPQVPVQEPQPAETPAAVSTEAPAADEAASAEEVTDEAEVDGTTYYAQI